MSFTLNNMHVRMKKFAMFQQNNMTILEMADDLVVSVLLLLRDIFGHLSKNL